MGSVIKTHYPERLQVSLRVHYTSNPYLRTIKGPLMYGSRNQWESDGQEGTGKRM